MKAIFLDRDGTLNTDAEYISRFEDFVVLPDVVPALRIFQDLGYRLFVVSNQSGVGRGYFSYEEAMELNRKADAWFRERGIVFDDMIICPHHVSSTDPRYRIDCDCRKPRPGMILELARRHGIDLAASYMVGDKRVDAEAGINAGATGVWLRIPGNRYAEPGRVDKAQNLKEFVSLLDFAHFLRELDGRNGSPGRNDPEQGSVPPERRDSSR